MTNIIVGLVGIVLGFLMVWKPNWFLEMIGVQAWAEKVFGPGRSSAGYQVIGLIIIFVSFLIMTDMMKGIVIWFFAPLMGWNK